MSEKFVIRDLSISKRDAIAQKESYNSDVIGSDWIGFIIKKLNDRLGKERLTEKEKFALEKWLIEEVGK